MSTDKINNGVTNCLSEYPRDTQLPVPMPLAKITQAVETINTKANTHLRKTFYGTSGASQLVQHRGRLGELLTQVYRRLGVGRKEEAPDLIYTTEKFRIIGRKINSALVEASQPGVKGGMLDSSTLALIKELFTREATILTASITKELDVQAAKQLEQSADDQITVTIPTSLPSSDAIPQRIVVEVPRPNTSVSGSESVETEEEALIDVLRRVKRMDNPDRDMRPREIIDFVEAVLNFTHGAELKDRQICTKVGIEWSTFRVWRQELEHYQAAAAIIDQIDKNTVVTNGGMRKQVFNIVMIEMRRRYPNQTEMKQKLREVGLYAVYYRYEYAKRTRSRQFAKTPVGQIVKQEDKPAFIPELVPPATELPLTSTVEVDQFAHLPQPAANILRQRAQVISALESGESGFAQLMKFNNNLIEEIANI